MDLERLELLIEQIGANAIDTELMIEPLSEIRDAMATMVLQADTIAELEATIETLKATNWEAFKSGGLANANADTSGTNTDGETVPPVGMEDDDDDSETIEISDLVL